MAQGEFTKQEAQVQSQIVQEMFDKIRKSDKLDFIGHLNDILLFLSAAERVAPDENAAVKKGQSETTIDLLTRILRGSYTPGVDDKALIAQVSLLESRSPNEVNRVEALEEIAKLTKKEIDNGFSTDADAIQLYVLLGQFKDDTFKSLK